MTEPAEEELTTVQIEDEDPDSLAGEDVAPEHGLNVAVAERFEREDIG